MDELGFVRITDRTKDLIKSGGEWISSVDLENALMAHPAIAEAAVIAIPDPKWSERPLACIVLSRGRARRRCSPTTLGKHLLGHGFAKWQLPDRYEVIDASRAPRPASSGSSSCASASRADLVSRAAAPVAGSGYRERVAPPHPPAPAMMRILPPPPILFP